MTTFNNTADSAVDQCSPFLPNHKTINPNGPAVQQIELVGRTYQVWIDEFGFYGIRYPKTGKSTWGMTGPEFDTFIVNLTWYLGYLSGMTIDRETACRYWFQVAITDNGGCWIWEGSRDKNGYGRPKINGKPTLAHRFAYMLAFGKFDPSLDVCHKCDNPSCVRPDHLFLGTHAENMHDAAIKGTRKGRVPSHRGEQTPTAKLTEKQVVEIIARYRRGGITQKQLAHEYGVSKGQIGNIVRRQRWEHIDEETIQGAVRVLEERGVIVAASLAPPRKWHKIPLPAIPQGRQNGYLHYDNSDRPTQAKIEAAVAEFEARHGYTPAEVRINPLDALDGSVHNTAELIVTGAVLPHYVWVGGSKSVGGAS